MLTLYKFIFVFLHPLYTVYDYLSCWWTYIKGWCWFRARDELFDREYLFSKVQNLKKIPKHVTVILGEDHWSISDLTNLALWCMLTGVPFISFYDHKGHLKHREDKFKSAINSRLKEDEHVIWHGSTSGYKNGFVGKKIHLKLLSSSDGRESVVRLCRRLALKSEIQKVSIEAVDEGLREEFEFPDPDLGIVCGKYFRLYGYPPWQIRLTEFLEIRTVHMMSVFGFVSLLDRFSRCQQRFGK